MISIAILDKDDFDLEREFKLTRKFFEERNMEFEITTYGKTQWFLYDLKERGYDVYLIEMNMPDRSGLEIAREIRKEYSESVIVFLSDSAKTEEVLPTYELGAFRYILREELEEKLNRCYESVFPVIDRKNSSAYVIEKRGRVEKIPYKEILYLRKDGKYVVITHKKGESRVRKALEEVWEELKSDDFLRVEKGYIVNLNHAEKMKSNELYMDNDAIIRVGKKRASHVREALLACWTGEEKV